jgi:hypothetical protein
MGKITGRARWLRLCVAALLAAGCLVAGGSPAEAATGLSGTVVEADSGDPVGGAFVAALRAADGTVAAGTVAAADGTYTLDGLAPGSYQVSVVDPAGLYAPGLAAGGAVFAVTSGSVVDADAALAPVRGSITGTVESDDGGVPLAGAWVAVLASGSAEIVAGAVTGSDGSFVVDDLLPATYGVVAATPSGDHEPEFFDDAPSPAAATGVVVEPGSVADVDLALPSREPVAAGAVVQGELTADGSGDPIAGAWVVALKVGTAEFAAGAVADEQGAYVLDVPPGNYVLEFVDPAGRHSVEWHEDQPASGMQSSTPVAASAGAPTTVDAALAPTTGALVGTVAEDESGDPVDGGWAVAIGPLGAVGAAAEADGSYRIDGLAPGAYRVTFVDPDGPDLQEYWSNSPTYAGATVVEVAAGATATADAGLAVPLCASSIPAAGSRCVPPFPLPVLGSGWSKYTVATGAHSATVQQGSSAPAPLAGLLFSPPSLRRYHFVFDPTAAYVLTNPTQPEDQFDWNKLPGLSDCGDVDLSQNGWMFGWRWRTDLTPKVLEITAYANNDGVHLTPPTPMVTLTQEQLAANLPLWFEMAISADRTRYEFRVHGPGSRTATASLPRNGCSGTGTPFWGWAAGFYFGGTSTAPNTVTGWINEPA